MQRAGYISVMSGHQVLVRSRGDGSHSLLRRHVMTSGIGIYFCNCNLGGPVGCNGESQPIKSVKVGAFCGNNPRRTFDSHDERCSTFCPNTILLFFPADVACTS